MAFSIFRNVAVSFVSCRIRRILVHLFFAFDHIYPALCLGSLNSTSSELETCLGVILVLSGTARGSVLTFETKNPLTWMRESNSCLSLLLQAPSMQTQ